MRAFTVACLVSGLFLQVGCASIPRMPKMATILKKRADPKASENFLTAKRLESQGKSEQARELYESMLAKDPQNPDYMHHLGVVCVRLQRYGEADNYFARAQKRDPKNASLLRDMGYSRYLRRDLAEAERLLRQAVHLKPSDKRSVNNLALVVGRQGKIDECLSLLKEAGDEATALASLAYIHSQRGEMDLAEQRYREALAKDPNQRDAVKAIAELEKHQLDGQLFADSQPTKVEALHFDEALESKPTGSAIQQVAAVADTTSQVKTAIFTEDSPALAEPGLLQENHSAKGRPTVSDKKSIASFDKDPFSADEMDAAPLKKNLEVQAAESEWAGDSEPAAKPALITTKKPTDSFDSMLDDDAILTTQPAVQKTAATERLTFVPSKTRLAQPDSSAARPKNKSLAKPAFDLDETE